MPIPCKPARSQSIQRRLRSRIVVAQLFSLQLLFVALQPLLLNTQFGSTLRRYSAATCAFAAPDEDQVPIIDLGDEYSSYRKPAPRPGPSRASAGRPFWKSALLYIPNRVLDFVDIFRFDIGVGPSAGAVLRLSKDGQLGYRRQLPGSVHVGLRGRRVPFFLETHDESGVGTRFRQTPDRQVQPAEFGAGIDVLLVGVYAGVDLGAVGDFCLGIFGVDLADDDL